MLKLKDLGERQIINRLMARHSSQSPKDDCSLIENGDQYFMVSSDIINPLTHLPSGATAEQAGRFFAAVNISDIAAMAGIPTGFMSAYSAPGNTDMDFLEGVEEGVNSVLTKYDVEHLGGDMKEGRELTMTGIAVGRQKKELTRKRSEIRPGQLIGVTGSLGKAAAGYIFYKTGYRKDLGISLMMDVQPRVKEAQTISRNGGKFMMDLSDGIFASLDQMRNDYGAGFKIVEDSVIWNRHVEKAAELSGSSPRDILFSYGGEYEILFTIENDNYASFMESMESNSVDVSIIGEVWDGDNMIFDGERWEAIGNKGYEHFHEKPVLGRIR